MFDTELLRDFCERVGFCSVIPSASVINSQYHQPDQPRACEEV